MTIDPTSIQARRLIECDIESWLRGRAYLNGVSSIAKRWPGMTFDRFYSILCGYPSHGGWSKEALRKAFEG